MEKMILAGLYAILAAALCLPFLVKRIEQELEIFLFIMGVAAVTLTSQWKTPLVKEALVEPVKITIAVFIAGFIFRRLQKLIAHNVNKLADAFGMKLFAFLVIVALGLLSSVITAIIAALVLVEIITCLTLDRKHEITLVVLACFSIGLGAALTPIGEPLSTIAIAKLKDAPYYAGFWFLFRHMGIFVLPGVLVFGVLGAFAVPGKRKKAADTLTGKEETVKDILARTGKLYLFVMALVLLGQGFKPVVEAYISGIPYQGLYWMNMVSAVLDNATLTAAEIGPALGLLQIKAALLGLLISGGMLIPGNIPNIIAAGKLKIKSAEWARIGLPLGLAAMVLNYFLIYCFFRVQ